MKLQIKEMPKSEWAMALADGYTPRAATAAWVGYVIVDEYGRRYDCTGGLCGSYRCGWTVFTTRDLAEAVLRSLAHLSQG
jgi:hypothetical protein